MKGCDRYEEMISRLIDGDLSEDEKALLSEHLKICPECAALYKAFSEVSSLLKTGLQEPPAELHESIMAQLRREDIKKKNKGSRGLKRFLTAAACFALLIAAALSFGPLLRSPVSNDAAAPEAAMIQPAEEELPAVFSSRSQAAPAAGEESAADEAYYAAVPAPFNQVSREELPSEAGNACLSAVPQSAAPFFSLSDTGQLSSLRNLLDGSPDSTLAEMPEASDFIVEYDSEEQSLLINIYCLESGIYYTESPSNVIFKANCQLDELEALLNNIG